MINFSCKNCSQKLNVEDKYSGKRVKCPKCGQVGVVPDSPDQIKFHCENCGQSIRVPQIHAGKKGKCPKCKGLVVVPSPKSETAGSAGTLSIVCPMCEEEIHVPETSRGQNIECPGCGSFIESTADDVTAPSEESDTTPTADNDINQDSPEEYKEHEGVDRRLIIAISAVAVIAVVGLVILVAVLRPSRSQQDVADTREDSIKLQLDRVQEFAEQQIGLLEKGEIDQACQFLAPGLADDINKSQVERLSEQIGKSRIIEMDCTRTQREQLPEGERVVLWYNLRCEEGTQAVIVSMLLTEQELTIDGIASQDHLGRTVSIGARSFTELSRMGSTAGRQRSRPSSGQIFFALATGFAIGTFFSTCCLWIGMKLTNVEGTFVALFGIAAISSLAGVVPVFIVPIPCIGWLLSLIVMFVLICKWTDAEFWPDAIGMVLIAGVVGILARILLNFLFSMA